MHSVWQQCIAELSVPLLKHADVLLLHSFECMLLQVLHVHGFSGVGLHCAYLVVACYQMYSCDFDTFTKSWESLPNPLMQLVASCTGSRTPLQRY